MKPNPNRPQARLWSGVLGPFCLVLSGPAHGQTLLSTADSAASKPAEAIPWSQVGARAGANYTGDGLAVSPAEGGARLRCVFQRLEGQATREGLWLTSTTEGKSGERFRLKAVAVKRAAPCAQLPPMTAAQEAAALPDTGKVEVAGQLVRFIRPGLVEEYSVSMDGLRQDFVVVERPAAVLPLNSQPSTLNPSAGQLRVELAVTGAKVQSTAHGAQLVLEASGRKIAYNRLRATDATGRELPARMEVQETSTLGLQPSAFHLALLVDDREAAYPIRIDPTFSDANWVSLGGIPGTTSGAFALCRKGQRIGAHNKRIIRMG